MIYLYVLHLLDVDMKKENEQRGEGKAGVEEEDRIEERGINIQRETYIHV